MFLSVMELLKEVAGMAGYDSVGYALLVVSFVIDWARTRRDDHLI